MDADAYIEASLSGKNKFRVSTYDNDGVVAVGETRIMGGQGFDRVAPGLYHHAVQQ